MVIEKVRLLDEVAGLIYKEVEVERDMYLTIDSMNREQARKENVEDLWVEYQNLKLDAQRAQLMEGIPMHEKLTSTQEPVRANPAKPVVRGGAQKGSVPEKTGPGKSVSSKD